MVDSRRRTFLVLSQVYVPDPASVGQHMGDAAAELAHRGHRIIVLTADRGYDDPSVRYEPRQVIDGVEVRRLPLSSFGKSSIAVRLLAGASFILQAVLRGLLVGKIDAILVSTSPPMAPLAALVLSKLKRARIKFWVMDLNPDQSIALGIIKETSLRARVFDWLNRWVLARATDVVVLDRFMAARVKQKLDVSQKLTVLPPWPHEDHLEAIAHEENPFRREHGLEGKFVVMYSGNHSPSNPVSTVLQAAGRLVDDSDLVFLFVGGGIGKKEVEAADSPNIRSLPYQPLENLRYSLSAADVHLVTVGDGVVGIVHPCKVYGAMAVARPVLVLGPSECHVSDIVARYDIGWHIPHGDINAAEELLRTIRRTDRSELVAKGERAQALVSSHLSKAYLCQKFCDIVEHGTGIRHPRHLADGRDTRQGTQSTCGA